MHSDLSLRHALGWTGDADIECTGGFCRTATSHGAKIFRLDRFLFRCQAFLSNMNAHAYIRSGSWHGCGEPAQLGKVELPLASEETSNAEITTHQSR
jgi:hypothetical protein